MKMEIRGMAELQAKLVLLPIETKMAVHSELVDIADDLKGKAQELAPKDKGDLRGSAFGEVEGLDCVVGFTEPYAMEQHENMSFHHTDGEAKYLETPYKANLPQYIANIGLRILKAVIRP
jgi:hypothetical protein